MVESLKDIITRPEVQGLARRVDENLGRCKIMAYLNNRSAGIDGFFSKADPFVVETISE